MSRRVRQLLLLSVLLALAATSASDPASEAAAVAGGAKRQRAAPGELQGLPAVPLPPPPPFPASPFVPSPFGGAQARPPNAFGSPSQSSSSSPTSSSSCGGLLRQRHGVLQTPGFPRKFPVPLECVWVIDASELAPPTGPPSNATIVVYLTQLYALGGLQFTEYMYYSDDYKVPAHRVFRLTEDDVTQVAAVQFASQYLEVRFSMGSLDGTHLRALDRLLDVYGFNITYEVLPAPKPFQCNTLQCRFLGHCYARQDFSSYYCACFPGFSGPDCGRGPLCEDPHTNVCQNGGTCKHIGDAAITCHCPGGFKGTKCEIPEINEVTMGCTANATASDCHEECSFDRSSAVAAAASSAELQSPAHAGRTQARSGKTRYEVTIRLGANLTAFYRASDPDRERERDRRPGDHLPSLLERHLSRVLRNFNITKISDLELITNSTDRLDITFHFFGVKGDSLRIRDAITRMVERGRIGNITLVSNFHLFDENPPLHLTDMALNHKAAIREGGEFIVSCTAQGSSRMQFQWFKDGALVNASKATREIWTTVLPPETKDVYTAILGVTNASRMDEGIYSCKVQDWGVEQCRSLHVHVRSPPRLRVDPASVTLHRGDSLRVRCLSPGNDDIKRYAQLGYSWTRNGQLFQSDPATVMWEDLYPDGSILKINNIQKSAEYACVVSNSVRPVSKSVYITVIDRSAVQLCRAESAFAVRWPTSAPGAAIVSDCPKGYEGYSRRVCEKRDVGNSSWLQPDFSLCIADQLLEIYNKFRALKAGFQEANSSAILKACFAYTNRRHLGFLPGEAGFLVDMLHEVDAYLQLKGTRLEREMAAEIILHVLDKVMQNPESLNSQQQIKKLQLLTQSAALNRETIAASQLATSTSSSSSSSSSSSAAAAAASSSSGTATGAAAGVLIASAADPAPAASAPSSSSSSSSSSTSSSAAAGSRHQVVGGPGAVVTVEEDALSLERLNSLRIYMTSVKTLPFNLRIYGDDLFSDQLYMDIGVSARLLNIMANSTIFASVISYKNLKSFLPRTYYTRGSDAKDTDYVLASRIVQTWLFQSNRSNDNFREPLDLPGFEAGHVEIIFQHEGAPQDSDWLPVCGHDHKASFESTWRSDLCITKNIMENMTRCICPLSGTYVVMLTKRSLNSSVPRPEQRPLFVIISCGCCLLQSCTAFAILLPIWYNRKCAVTFLKMQFCVSTSSVMVIFLLGFLKMLPVNMQAVVSSSLASLLLFGVSTLIAIALVIHSEMVPKKLCHVTTNATTAALVGGKRPQQHHQQQQQQQPHQQHHHHQQQLLQKQEMELELDKRGPGSGLGLHRNNSKAGGNNKNITGNNLSAGIRGAIGISWLLPLLFAIASPLICSIIGEWPQHWWLEVATAAPTRAHGHALEHAAARDVFRTGGGGLFNGDNLFEPAATAATTASATTTTAAGPGATGRTATAATATMAGSTTAATATTNTPLSTPSLDQRHQHGGILTSGSGQQNIATAVGAATTAAGPASLSFVTFVVIDALLVLLFAALLTTLVRKLLWLLRKNQNPHPHPLGKFKLAIDRRIGLLYRCALLLCLKLATDALFVAYVNARQEDSFWGYPFGVATVLLGFAVLFCFVIKAEYSLRGPGSAGSASLGTLKTKLSSSKTSLDENYCSGSINSPLSFYTSHEKEKDNECGVVPAALTTILTHPGQQLPPPGQQMPLTIISTAPRCQGGVGGGGVETFLGGSLDRKGCLQDMHQPHSQPQQQLQQQQPLQPSTKEVLGPGTVASPAARCCSLLGGVGGGAVGGPAPGLAKAALADGGLGDGASWQTQVGVGVGVGVGVVYYDAYVAGGLTGSLARRQQQQQQQQHQLQQLQQQQQQQLFQAQPLLVDGQHEFVGVETLDILQGVAPDSIIGIRTSAMLGAHHPQQQQLYHQQQLPQHHKPFVEAAPMPPPPALVSMASYNNPPATAASYMGSMSTSSSSSTVTTNSVTTQTPKAQKRVTIVEPTTHTFDPMLPPMAAGVASMLPLATSTATPTPIITITCSSLDEPIADPGQPPAASATSAPAMASATAPATPTPDDENSITGMFDRISHDLDYLLNRTNELPPEDDDIPPPPLPPSGSIPVQHDVIIEESEQE